MIRPHRTHPLWYAFILHRVSGALLALFLPAHFWVLSMALNEAARLWINGLEAVKRKIGLRQVIDLSATPFFLKG